MRCSISPLKGGLLQQCPEAASTAFLCASISCRSYTSHHRPARALSKTAQARCQPTFSHAGTGVSSSHRSYSTTAKPEQLPPRFAFAFDIDGVLLRSSTPLPGASKALQYLHDNSIPFILLTNGGGKLESERVKELSEKLGVPIREENFVQSHTPFKLLLDDSEGRKGLRDATILVTGGDGNKCREVAESYGFKNVVTPADILMANPKIWPFNQVFTDYYKASARPLPKPWQSLKVDAIMVFNDPRDWALDSQIMIDLLLSQGGVLGTVSKKNGDAKLKNDGFQQDGQPLVYYSNPDVLWASSYHLPRLGQGAFQAAFQGLWLSIVSQTPGLVNPKKLECVRIGKPSLETFQYGQKVLCEHRAEMFGAAVEPKDIPPLERVFMVGDNPASDIRGANLWSGIMQRRDQKGPQWSSILVKTGVYRSGQKLRSRPKVIVEDVLTAVQWALNKQRWKGKIE